MLTPRCSWLLLAALATPGCSWPLLAAPTLLVLSLWLSLWLSLCVRGPQEG